MKKLSLLTLVLLMVMGGVDAQQNNLKITHSIDASIPQKVCNAIEAEYPGLTIHQPVTAATTAEKAVKNEPPISSQPAGKYFVHHSGKNYHKKVLYDQSGRLLFSREKIVNRSLPIGVYKFIGREYNGWLIKKTMTINIVEAKTTAPQHTTYYKVLLQNGKRKKWQLVEEQGGIYAQKLP